MDFKSVPGRKSDCIIDDEGSSSDNCSEGACYVNKMRSWEEDESYSDIEDTIAEEEALEQEMSPEEELRILSQDMKTPLAELLSGIRASRRTRDKASAKVSETPKYDKQLHRSELAKFYFTRVANADTRTDSDDGDEEYVPLGAVRREVRVGALYQADIDSVVATAEDPPSDTLLWKPSTSLSEDALEQYLKTANQMFSKSNVAKRQVLSSVHVRDNPLALELLMNWKYVISDSVKALSELLSDLEDKSQMAKVFQNGKNSL